MANKDESTHVVLQDGNIIISPNLRYIFNFLMEIEKEIQSSLFFDKKLQEIKNQSLDLISLFLEELEKNTRLPNESIAKKIEELAEKFQYNSPGRSQFIVLFAYLETLFCLFIAYRDEVSDKGTIRRRAMNSESNRNFIDEFILSEKNEFYKNNKERFRRVTAEKIRDLRNMLGHFFSVSGGINICPSGMESEARKIEKTLKNDQIGFMSPYELFKLLESATRLLITKWGDDYSSDSTLFKNKITFVKKIVQENGAQVVNLKI